MGDELHVLNRAASGYDAFLRMGGAQLGIEARDRQDQEWTAGSFRSRLLLLYLGRRAIALGERLGKGLAQKMAPLRWDDDQTPRGQKSVIRRCACRAEDFLYLFAVWTRIAEPFG